MPKHIRDTRTITRKITTAHGADLIVTLAPEGLVVREPRRRKSFILPYGVAFQQAVALTVAAERPSRRRPVRRGFLRGA